MVDPKKWKPEFRLWLEDERRHVIIDQTDAMLLRRISETNSITEAARAVGVSYRNAWSRIKALERKTGRKMVETIVGGKTGGGASLTAEGKALLVEFRRMRRFMYSVLDDRDSWGDVSFVLSARNRLPARIISISVGENTSEVKMATTGAAVVNSVITNGAVSELGLRLGDAVEAVVKSTDVLIAKDNRRLSKARVRNQGYKRDP